DAENSYCRHLGRIGLGVLCISARSHNWLKDQAPVAGDIDRIAALIVTLERVAPGRRVSFKIKKGDYN
ncbi:MAG: hypothetical protein R6U95_03405, partial [Bacteroidales bacterium]